MNRNFVHYFFPAKSFLRRQLFAANLGTRSHESLEAQSAQTGSTSDRDLRASNRVTAQPMTVLISLVWFAHAGLSVFSLSLDVQLWEFSGCRHGS